MPNWENGTSGLECRSNTQFFVPSTELFPEDVELLKRLSSLPAGNLFRVFIRFRQFQAILQPCRYHSRKERMEPLSNGIPSSLMGISPKFPISNFQRLLTIWLKVSGRKCGRKVNDTRLFGSFRQEISPEQRNSSYKAVLFFPDGIFQTEISVPFLQSHV